MKTKTKVILIIGFWVVLFIIVFGGIKILEHNGTDFIEKSVKVKTIVRDNELRNRKAVLDGNVRNDVEEINDSLSDEEKQLISEHVAKVKEIFKGHEYLLDSPEELELTIDLKNFKDGKEYRFEQLLWNISFDQVQNALPYSLLEYTDGAQVSEGYTYYVAEYKHDLYGQTAAVTFEFYEDQLKMVQITFSPEGKKKKVENFFEGIVETLTDNCGQESVKEEDDTAGYVSYLWLGENSMLQVERVDSRVTIIVGSIEVK